MERVMVRVWVWHSCEDKGKNELTSYIEWWVTLKGQVQGPRLGLG